MCFLSLLATSICRAVRPSAVGASVAPSLNFAVLRCVVFTASCAPLIGSAFFGYVPDVTALKALDCFRYVLPYVMDCESEAYILGKSWANKVDFYAGRGSTTFLYDALRALDWYLGVNFLADFLLSDEAVNVLDDANGDGPRESPGVDIPWAEFGYLKHFS